MRQTFNSAESFISTKPALEHATDNSGSSWLNLDGSRSSQVSYKGRTVWWLAASHPEYICSSAPLEMIIYADRLSAHLASTLTLVISVASIVQAIPSLSHKHVPRQAPVQTGLPPNWRYNACYIDNAFGRILETNTPSSSTQTVQTCIAACQALNFAVAGLQFGNECYCGNRLVNGAATGSENTCNMPCAGNAAQACGGPNRLSIYTSLSTIPIVGVPTIKRTGLPGNWAYTGCLREPGAARVLPYQNIYTTNNTVNGCLNQCATFGYPIGGMEFSDECWCGDQSDVAGNGGVMGADSECISACSGDPTSLCGGVQRLQLYTWAGALNTWQRPGNTGRYEFFVPGVVVPLIATLGINNKVTFLEKDGTGAPNSTGAYELDLSLVSNFDKAWRTMNVKTDVFCAASIILPDKAGRQINIGGWADQSTFGLRLYTPSGSDGIPGTTDWEEDVNALSLQRGRWYPSAIVLANSSVLVIGGETQENGPPQPNLEIIPRIPGGDTVVELDWLIRTHPNNLYPFLYVLPSGRLFVAYYNEARILDPNTFATVRELANIPGAVNNFFGGRTYPYEGAAMSFPQRAPYNEPFRVLICGGSAGAAGNALDNCVTIAPEAANPTWTIERMPSRRVMACMVPLPDGTFMIMNGAQQGVAGFRLATNPNLNALLYDPSRPLNQRISILGSTIVARMYHSEATLLPDASVLVSGSDPGHLPGDNPSYPQEFRIERYVPPYLSQGFRQPEFTITNKDWAYGSSNRITVRVFQGPISNVRISLIAASSSTHGNTMGSRTIFPAFSCGGTTCTITAPPNANISPPGWHMLFVLDGPTPSRSQWIRIGGDPARIGDWPAMPGFTPPGV